MKRLPDAQRNARLVELWQNRPRDSRTSDDIGRFYGWLAEHASELIPPGPGTLGQLIGILQTYVIDPLPDGVQWREPLDSTPYWVITDRRGAILGASEPATHLLGVTHRRLLGRSLLLFMPGDRLTWLARVQTAALSEARYEAKIRPRETRPVVCSIVLRAMSHEIDADVRWTFDVKADS